MTELESFACSGTDKEAFIKALDFITGINEYDINGFFIDTTEYLVFCKYISENKQNEMAYPFKQTSISLAEHAFSYLESLSDDDLRKWELNHLDTKNPTISDLNCLHWTGTATNIR